MLSKITIRFSTLCLFVSLAVLLTAISTSQAETTPAHAGDPYLLDTCPVSGAKLGSMGKPVVVEHEGREMRFCCNGCPSKFKADPAKYLAKVDEQLTAMQKPYYPVTTCPISGQKLGAMGKPVEKIVRNRLVMLCCAGCEKQLNENPDAALAKLDTAVIEAQKADYPLTTCVVSGDKLGSDEEVTNMVIGNRLVRLCCDGCIKSLRAEPVKYWGKLDGAVKEAKGHERKH